MTTFDLVPCTSKGMYVSKNNKSLQTSNWIKRIPLTHYLVPIAWSARQMSDYHGPDTPAETELNFDCFSDYVCSLVCVLASSSILGVK